MVDSKENELKEKLHLQADNTLRFLRIVSKFAEELHLQNKKFGIPPSPLIDGDFVESSISYAESEYLKALATNNVLLGRGTTYLHTLIMNSDPQQWDKAIDDIREAIETMELISKNTE